MSLLHIQTQGGQEWWRLIFFFFLNNLFFEVHEASDDALWETPPTNGAHAQCRPG